MPVYCVDPHPSCPYTVAVATEDGNIIVADTRTPSCTIHTFTNSMVVIFFDIFSLSNFVCTVSMDMVVDESSCAYHSVAFNPLASHLLVTASELSGTSLFDIRQSKR